MFPALATVASPPEWVAERTLLVARIADLERQVAWFQRQLFGEKSERRHIDPPPEQMALGEGLGDTAPATLPPQPVAAHQRQRAAKAQGEGTEPALFFDPERVPVETINVPNPAIAALPAAAYEVIGEKVTHRLAQRPGSYVVLKYVRQVVKVKDTEILSCPPAPAGVLEGGRADVSFLAGLIVDKFLYHLPLYRQHQRLLAAGVEVSRQWLTQQVLAVALLLAPIVAAQLAGIRACRVKAMDETPIKAGRQGPGKLHQGYFWPIWGDIQVRPITGGRARGQSGGRQGAAHRRLWGLRAVRRALRASPCPMLGLHPTHLRAGPGHRAGGRGLGLGAHRRPLPHRG
jgi:transposase